MALSQALDGEAPETLNARVIDWAPDLQIHLQVTYAGGLLRATRYMEIEKLTEEGCIFSHGERVSGFLAPFVPRRLRRAARQSFAAMSAALKAQAEQAWRRGARNPIFRA
jgi:hypothetical protein